MKSDTLGVFRRFATGIAILIFGAISVLAAPDGTLTDTNIKYLGRWDFSSSSQYVSYWGGAYIKVKFSGTTVKIKLNHASNFYVNIDGGTWTTYAGVNGTVNLTPTPLASGTHTLSVAQGKDYDYVFNFQGLILDAGATTSAPTVSTNLIEFTGDSITAGYTCAQADVSDYAWVCAENLGVEHTQIAYPGKNLVSGYTGTGMDVQYFKQQNFSYPSSPNWDFTKYSAKVVVINLGQNDIGANGVPLAVFQSTYVTFMANIRAQYPNADIFALRTFGGLGAAQTQAAVAARNAAGDAKVHYVDTTGWLGSYPGTDWDDGVHPSVAGHIKIANQLQPILAPYVGGTDLVDGTYKLINRNSGLTLDAKGQNTTNGTRIQQYTYGAGANQKWTVTALGGGQYKIIGVQSGRSLDVKGQSTADGALIQLYDDNGGANQKWVITPTSGGYNTIQGVQSGKMMEVLGNATTNGAAVDQWSNTGGNNQQWLLQAP